MGQDRDFAEKRIMSLVEAKKLNPGLAHQIFRGQIPIRNLPNLADIEHLGHRSLINCLLQCPESKYFNYNPRFVNKQTLDKRRALKLVYDMVSKAVTLKKFGTIDEEDSILE